MAHIASNGSLVSYIISIHQSIETLKNNITNYYPQLTIKFTELTDQLVILLDFIAQIAPSYDYNNIPCNGNRSVIKFISIFLKLATKIQTKNEIEQVIQAIDSTSFVLRQLVRIHEIKSAIEKKKINKIDTNNDNDMIDEMKNALKQIHRESLLRIDQDIENVMRTFLSSRFFCMHIPAYRFASIMVVRVLSAHLATNSVSGLRYLIMSHNSMIDFFIKTTTNASSQNVARFVRFVDRPIPKLAMKTMVNYSQVKKSSFIRKTIKVNIISKYELVIDSTGKKTILINRKIPKMVNIKFRLNRFNKNTNETFNGKIIYYIHGGGFLGPTAEGAELMYINNFSQGLPSVTFINIDYSVAPENTFPTQLQEILDLYIWLTSENEIVYSLLGFEPNDISIAGDSAGANLALGLIIVLNDIYRFGYDTSIVFPKSIVGFFGKYIVNKEICPSLMLAAADPIVPYPVLVKMSCFARYRKYDENNNQNWTLVTVDVTKDKVMTDDKFEVEPCPYLQPLLYQFFDSKPLKSIPLYLLGLDFCPLLDETVDMAKAWKGPVTFTHLDNCPHGGCYFTLVDSSATRQIMSVSIELLKRSLDE